MNPNKEYFISFNRNKILSAMRLNGFFIILFSFGLWQFTIKPNDDSTLFQVLAIPLILFFLFSLISTARKLNDKSPALVVNSVGIVENTSFFPAGLIPWEDVIGMHTKQARSARWLIIEVRDPEQYLRKDNLLTYMFQKLNHFFGGSPIFISAGFIDTSFDDMVKLVYEYYDKYGRAQSQ